MSCCAALLAVGITLAARGARFYPRAVVEFPRAADLWDALLDRDKRHIDAVCAGALWGALPRHPNCPRRWEWCEISETVIYLPFTSPNVVLSWIRRRFFTFLAVSNEETARTLPFLVSMFPLKDT